MRHFTMTGIAAGRPICGISRAEAQARGERLEHPAYNSRAYEAQLCDLCADCRRVWDDAEAQIDAEITLD